MSNFNYRIVQHLDDDIQKVSIARVSYKEDDEVDTVESMLGFSSLEEALSFTDKMYKASMLSVIEKLEDGSYE